VLQSAKVKTNNFEDDYEGRVREEIFNVQKLHPNLVCVRYDAPCETCN
jgi:hypothetical protein